MEMCYDGALVMPSSYAVMDEEEMMYVEGGGELYFGKISTSYLTHLINGGIVLSAGSLLGMSKAAFGAVFTYLVPEYIISKTGSEISNYLDKNGDGYVSFYREWYAKNGNVTHTKWITK